MDTNYFVNEGDCNLTLIILVRGGTNRCNKAEWSLNYAIQSVSAQCEQVHNYCIQPVQMQNYVLIIASEDYSATGLGGIIHVSDSQPALVMIPIIVDDNILESNETFQVEIGILNTEDRKCVALQPNVVDITIMDDDSKLSKIRHYRTVVT